VPNAVQLSLPDAAPPPSTQLAYADFAAGCFWGLQQLLSRTPGVLETTAGYTQGAPRERPPTYGRVSSGKTGHVEAVRALYDPALVSYEGLLAVYMASLEDACDARGQGADRGFQYRPGIYWHDEAQRAAAEAALAAEAAARRVPALAVELKPATAFWEAEEVHQHYLERGGLDPQPEVPYWLGCYVDMD
jgi:methionine-S-sulfoxide reductase